MFGFGYNCIWTGCVTHSVLPRDNTSHPESISYQTVSRFQILLRKYFWKEVISESSKNVTKLLPFRSEQCFGPFNMLTVRKCSETGLFRHLSNHAFWSSGVNRLTNSLKISDASKKEFFKLKFFLIDKKIWQNYFREHFSSVLDILTCWLFINVLTRGFLCI